LDYKHDGQGFVDGRYHHLFVVPATGGDVTQLTSGAWDVAGFDWSPDGEKLVVAGNSEPNADLQRALNLYVVDLAARRSKLVGGFYLGSPTWSPRGDMIAFIAPNGLDAGLLERLWIVPAGGGDQRCLTIGLDQAVSDSLITDMRAGPSTRMVWPGRESFTAADGWVVEGWMLRPADFDPNRIYPLVLEIHGRPHGQYGSAFMHEFQVLAGMGYMVLYINPRGSDGYGEHFRRQVV